MVPCELRVIYGDTDRMGVVYYANYLRFFEAGRGAFIRAQGRSYRDVEDRGVYLPVVEVTSRYLASAVYDDLLVVETSVREVRRASVRFSYRVVRKDDRRLLCEGETVHACVGRDGRPTRLPEDLKALLQELPSPVDRATDVSSIPRPRG
jgi:acyl-CoA thioester hydrolase